ncbi:BnaC02g35230D [Brassica napus]|uniref:(rape) hypothetical protein n=1 Tax=Brassica napus TaxID=3708 RepID=A0A078I786_BRANA|nr:unnamed protein product [Brassica napus]CDY45721.1 BnaC02g35230D [Brassica napus]
MNSLEKVDPVFYMDKNVTACDLPEIVVCYNEKTYHVVKDICVDDSVRSNSDSNSNQCSPNPLKTKSLKDRNCKLEDSELRNDPEANQDVEETSRDEVATSENVLKESLTLEDEQKPLNNSNKNNKREEQSLLQLQEKGTRSLGTPALKTELEETVDPEKAQEKFSSVSTKTSQGLFGETSFSAAEPVSGHITYSGQIVFSGSLSVRSDASTTSGRSFAFPVLQSEWNSSSPVRMAKANKKRQKGWRDILMCCRFS